MSKQTTTRLTTLYAAGVGHALQTRCPNGQAVGQCKYGVYVFYDYDGEPIYVGQTTEKLSTRIRRHLTNQRSDAVAMGVLDPFEVAEIEMWPIWELQNAAKDIVEDTLNRAEFTVYQQAVARSQFHAVLNEKDIAETAALTLPSSLRLPLLPEEERRIQNHPDTRIARRAQTIAKLARVISERSVQPGIRRTLLAQAQRLEHLARARLQDMDR